MEIPTEIAIRTLGIALLIVMLPRYTSSKKPIKPDRGYIQSGTGPVYGPNENEIKKQDRMFIVELFKHSLIFLVPIGALIILMISPNDIVLIITLLIIIASIIGEKWLWNPK